MTRPTMPRSLAMVAMWPFGIGLTSWHYMWRTTPLHRREEAGSAEDDAAPELPPGVCGADVQRPEDGAGALFHRRYSARIRGTQMSADDLMTRVSADPDAVAPSEFARFTKRLGDDGAMRTGDEYVVRMPGPWNGPVRVAAVTPRSFRLVTLRGHLEAGQIEFRVREDDGGDGDGLVFTIESWASSGDRLSRFLYERLRMAKEVQLHMWTSVLENAAKLCGGRLSGGMDVETRRLEAPVAAGERVLGDPGAKNVLDALHDKALNFELGPRADFTAERGWHVDSYRQPLRAEEPGPPRPDGTWEVASRLMRDYEFADPAIVRAVYYGDRLLQDRDLLLEARFWGLRFHLGVRVGGVIDGTRRVDGRDVRVWGWNYRTLQGHLEMGQMDYEVWKWVDTGEVEFRISAFSRGAPMRNPILRIGFRLFGRHEQVKFARHACARMAKLTDAALGHTAGDGVRRAGDTVVVRPLPAS
jgi:uncharacterized protein (UPF0548 family)